MRNTLLLTIVSLTIGLSPAYGQATSTGAEKASPYNRFASPFSGAPQPATSSPDNWLAGTGDWSTSSDWSVGVPTSSSAVTINTSSGNVTENQASASAASLSILSGNILSIISGSTLTVSGATTVSGESTIPTPSELLVDNADSGGGTLNTGSLSLSDHGTMYIGNYSMTSAATVNVNGAFSNTSGGFLQIEGGKSSGANALLNVTGAAPSTLTGTYQINGSTGSAAVEFGSGAITVIGEAGGSPGFLWLDGGKSYLEIGATNSNSALTTLSTINGQLRLTDGASLTTTVGLTVNNGALVQVDNVNSGGSTLTIGGAYANSGDLYIGNYSMSSPATVNVNGAYSSNGDTLTQVEGGNASGANALLNVTGAAPSTLTGTYQIFGSTGSAALKFGSGGITAIGDGSTNQGLLWLDGSKAYVEIGATDNSSALAGLSTIASNGQLRLTDGASVTTSVGLTVNYGGDVQVDNTNSGGSTLTVGGAYANKFVLDIGNYGITSPATVNVNGAYSSTGYSTLQVEGGSTSGANALLNVTGAAPSTLTGNYWILGSTGSAAVKFGSGGITTIGGDGSPNQGYLWLDTSKAYVEIGATNSNSALSTLSTIASNGLFRLTDGASVTTGVGLTVDNGGQVVLDNGNNGGSTLTVGGAFANSGNLYIGNYSISSPSTVNVNGAYSSTGTGFLQVEGGSTSAATALLNVTGAAPSTLTGDYWVYGSTGSAAVKFGSGAITTIGDGSTNPGYVWLDTSKAYLEVGATNSNSALTTLSTIASNGQLQLTDGASLTTSVGLNNAGIVGVDNSKSGGSTMTVGGTYTNSGNLYVGYSGITSPATLNVNGTFSSTGAGKVDLYGGTASGANALLNVTGAAPSTLTGTYDITGSTGSAAMKFGSGGITAIGDGSSNQGDLFLTGSNAYAEVGATNSNSALTNLNKVASNGTLELWSGSSVTTSVGLTVSSGGQVLVDSGNPGGSTLTVGGAYANSGALQVGNFKMGSTSTLNVNGTFSNSASGSVKVEGGDTSGGNAVLNISGAALTNSGTIALYGYGGKATLEISSGNVTLSGPGKVILSNSADGNNNLIIPASGTSTLTNSSTIEGAGLIENIGIVNKGTLLANQSNALVILPSSAGVNNQGTLSVGSGDLMQIGTSSGGALTNFSGTTLTGGVYSIGGTLWFGASGTSLVTNAANITLTGASSQMIDFAGQNILAAFATNAATGSFTITGGRNFTTAGNFTNNGVLNIGSGSTFDVNGNLTNFSSNTLTGGTYGITGTLQFNNADIVTNAANITLNGTSSKIINQSSVNALTNFANNASTGSFTLAGSQSLTTSGGSFTNNGLLTISKGSTFTVGNGGTISVAVNYTQAAGTTQVDGTLTSTTSSTTPTLTVSGGTLDGAGALTYTVVDSGTVLPGDSKTSTAALKITGPYTQSSGGALDISIGGKTAGTQYDQLNVTGAAGVNGTLNLSLVNSFVPAVGTTFTILNASSVSGAFATVNGTSINSSEHFTVTYNSNDVVLTVASGAGLKPPMLGPQRLWASAGLGRPLTYNSYQPASNLVATVPVRSTALASEVTAAHSNAVSNAAFRAPRNLGALPNRNRLEYGLNLLSLFGTNPKRLMTGFLSQPGSANAAGYVSFSGIH
jgi:hypothetical protein